MKYLLLILALMIPQMAAARLGETVEQCDKRYGKVAEKDKSSKIYESKGYRIEVRFQDSVCWCITYRKLDKSLIAQSVIEKLKSLAGVGWEVTHSGNGMSEWQTDLMIASDFVYKGKHQLMIRTKAGVARNMAELEKPDLKGVEGF